LQIWDYLENVFVYVEHIISLVVVKICFLFTSPNDVVNKFVSVSGSVVCLSSAVRSIQIHFDSDSILFVYLLA